MNLSNSFWHIQGIDVNLTDRSGLAALHFASQLALTETVKLLLAHPDDINVNQQTKTGTIPLSFACFLGKELIVRELLKDPRVDAAITDDSGCTALWKAAYMGREGIIEWLIASGKDLGDLNRKGKSSTLHKKYSAIEVARVRSHTEVVALLERFMGNPTRIRHKIKGEGGSSRCSGDRAVCLDGFLLR